MTDRPLPQPTLATEPYWQAARGHRLMIQACRACGHRQFYPRNLCLSCLGEELGWTESAGRGRIYTFTINHRPAQPSLQDKVPYAVAMIDLDEGVRMMANIVNARPADIAIGRRVRVVFEDAGEGMTLPQFELCDEPGAG
ncbi:MAG: Zn-ribbon domain-containing OB-fold protein [Noviherbaspirillum sp.]